MVDTSVAIKFVTQEPGSEAAYRFVIDPVPLIAPDWMLVESASALWKKVKYSQLLEIHARYALECLPQFFARLAPSGPLLEEALGLSFKLRHPVYDCLFLALGLREGAPVLTADREFHMAVTKAGVGQSILLDMSA